MYPYGGCISCLGSDENLLGGKLDSSASCSTVSPAPVVWFSSVRFSSTISGRSSVAGSSSARFIRQPFRCHAPCVAATPERFTDPLGVRSVRILWLNGPSSVATAPVEADARVEAATPAVKAAVAPAEDVVAEVVVVVSVVVVVVAAGSVVEDVGGAGAPSAGPWAPPLSPLPSSSSGMTSVSFSLPLGHLHKAPGLFSSALLLSCDKLLVHSSHAPFGAFSYLALSIA